MYQVHFSANNFEESVILPHVPPDFPLPLREQHNETYTGISRDLRRIGSMGLRKMAWSSFFPVIRSQKAPMSSLHPFMPTFALNDGWEYVKFFRKWRERKVPLRINVIDYSRFSVFPRLSMACTIDTFEISIGRNGYIYYDISLTEYRFVDETTDTRGFIWGA